MKNARLTLCVLSLLALGSPVHGMIYRPKTGDMWDPSVIWHGGKYYAFMMYRKAGDATHGHCLLASSKDGVHWEDEGAVLEERDRGRGAVFCKCFVARCGDRFIMDYGVVQGKAQDILRFYESRDLKHWDYLFSNQPDRRWYGVAGQAHRWDHMYILPKEEGNPRAGYWGYPVAIPRPNLPRSPGMMQSPDGRTWEILPPPKMDWGATPGADLEIGGCERAGGRLYMIGGTGGYLSGGYSMYTFVAENPRGPFRPDVKAFRLCGCTSKNVTWLAAWARGDGELLISNYVTAPNAAGGPWLLPLRKPVVDADGHLRLGWWKGNEKLKGEPLPLGNDPLTVRGDASPDGYGVMWLDTALDMKRGGVLEGTIRADASAGGGQHRAGFVLDESPGQAMAIQLGIGKPDSRETHLGRLTTTPDGKHTFQCEDVTGKGCATLTGIDGGKEHAFRLLVRRNLFELYIDDLLVQTYAYQAGSGKVGLLARNADAVFARLKAWNMSLSARDR